MISCRLSTFRPRLIVSGIMFGLIFLVAASALSAEPEHKYDGVYTGKRSLTKGTASATCPAGDDASVTIDGQTLTFTTSTLKKYIMPFYPHRDGSFGQTHTGDGIVHYHGRITGDVIEAAVENPHCEYHWHLKRQ
jgi:hypothetical protein